MSFILCAAVAFASRSLEYMRFPDTTQVFGGSLHASSISQEELVLRYFGAITKPHWALSFCDTPHLTNGQRGLARARFLPGQPRELSAGGFSEVRLGVFGCFLLALFDIVNRLRWRDPTLRVDVVHGCLYTLSVVFREQPQVFAAYFNFCPYPQAQRQADISFCTQRKL